MRKLKEFKDIHKDEDIYILASGKSVDFIDSSFFNNKIVIGINQVYKKTFCKYLLRKEAELIKECIQQSPKSTFFISKGTCGGENEINYNLLQSLHLINNNNIVVYDHLQNITILPNTLPPEPKLIVSHSSITTGIHLAAYMGAKNIILVGHDCGTIDEQCNFTGYHTESTYKIAHTTGEVGYRNWIKVIEHHTIQLKKMILDTFNANIYSLNPFINFGLEGHVYKR
jgi:hypothetical protein|tara:strand:- start:4 stop:684 length:681 start_codon:yes stop_codon:yes gene_type:complete